MNIRETAQAVPPVGVGGLTLWGYGLSEWVLVLTAIYTLFLIIDKLPAVATRVSNLIDWIKDHGKERGNRE